ncbi:hypothetical protein [Acidovorax sp. NCPPB 3576]|uniref:hypothetical protein n=1 Tax=Acidovorax sp. NCPPB 3576 TaxID=2940488 RepID=UPI00234B4ABE|nr:hypothetical protein [Acidovorax sp. NCPPB 3576]WCM86400.1 hypothetical protein M5C98_13460 [Acidovorax sp. NCPPB 3576]
MKRWIALATAVMVSGAVHAANAASSAHATHAADNAAGVVHVANPELLSALQNLKASLTADRTPLAFDNGASAKNCVEYSDLLSKSQPVESTRNFEIRSEYLLCDSIRLVAGKPFVAEKASASGQQAKALYEKLDLRSFPSSLRNRADAKKHTLKTLLPGKPQSEGGAVKVETPDQFFRLEVVGTIDHGKGRKPEWIVWVTDELKNGTYRGYSNIVVHPPRTASGLYTAAGAAAR